MKCVHKHATTCCDRNFVHLCLQHLSFAPISCVSHLSVHFVNFVQTDFLFRPKKPRFQLVLCVTSVSDIFAQIAFVHWNKSCLGHCSTLIIPSNWMGETLIVKRRKNLDRLNYKSVLSAKGKRDKLDICQNGSSTGPETCKSVINFFQLTLSLDSGSWSVCFLQNWWRPELCLFALTIHRHEKYAYMSEWISIGLWRGQKLSNETHFEIHLEYPKAVEW